MGRRKKISKNKTTDQGYWLDLLNCNLQGALLDDANFSNAQFDKNKPKLCGA